MIVEFVSANPTGPLYTSASRQAALARRDLQPV
jgi:arginyl-tRNA synthetase